MKHRYLMTMLCFCILLTPFFANADDVQLVKTSAQQKPGDPCKRFQSRGAYMNDLHQLIKAQ